MTYDEQLISEGKCPELVWIPTPDSYPGRTDGRCLAPIAPASDGGPGFACEGHTAEIEAYLSKPLEQRWAEDAEAERYGSPDDW